jgi:hypothetical protein
MSYGFQIRITKPLSVHPEAMGQGVKMLMGEAGQILEHTIGERTPRGVGGTRTGLAASIFSEVREQGTRITTITGTNKAHAMPVEFGRRPGQRPPPVNALLDWVGLRFGISDPKQQRSLAFRIARAIGKRGTRSMRNSPSGERMFEQGLAAAEPLILQRAEQIVGQVAKEIIR